MSETPTQVERIQQKLQLLLRQWYSLRKENERLQKETAQLRQQESVHRETIGQLSRQVEVLKVTSGGLGAEDKKAMEKQINGYIREIDRCIALLTE
jgi:phage-related minor tail protein